MIGCNKITYFMLNLIVNYTRRVRMSVTARGRGWSPPPGHVTVRGHGGVTTTWSIFLQHLPAPQQQHPVAAILSRTCPKQHEATSLSQYNVIYRGKFPRILCSHVHLGEENLNLVLFSQFLHTYVKFPI